MVILLQSPNPPNTQYKRIQTNLRSKGTFFLSFLALLNSGITEEEEIDACDAG